MDSTDASLEILRRQRQAAAEQLERLKAAVVEQETLLAQLDEALSRQSAALTTPAEGSQSAAQPQVTTTKFFTCQRCVLTDEYRS